MVVRKTSKILKVKDIVWDRSVYPRNNYNWMVATDYASAMKQGDKLPQIMVALHNNKHLIMDGKHRLEAHKICKLKNIKTTVVSGLTKEQIYIESVKLNNVHGYRFGVQERAKIIVRLKDMGVSMGNISKIISMPMDKISSFTVKQVTDTISGRQVALKPSLTHLAGETVADDIDIIQEPFEGSSQLTMIKEINSLLKNKLIDWRDKKLVEELKVLYKLLGSYKKLSN